MDQEEILKKLFQIEEQARDGIADFPNLGLERLKMIAALARFARNEITHGRAGAERRDEDPRGDQTGTPPSRLN